MEPESCLYGFRVATPKIPVAILLRQDLGFAGKAFPSLQPAKRVFRYPFEAGRPRNAPVPSAHESVKDATRRSRGGSFVTLLDSLSASGMFQ